MIRLSGVGLPSSYTTTTDRATLTFFSDPTFNGPGFVARLQGSEVSRPDRINTLYVILIQRTSCQIKKTLSLKNHSELTVQSFLLSLALFLFFF